MAPQLCECPSDIITDVTMNATDTHARASPFTYSDPSKSKFRLAHNEATSFADAGKEEAICFSEATTEFNTPPLREKGPDMSKALHAHDEATSTDGGNDFIPFGIALSSQGQCHEDSEAPIGRPTTYPKMLMLQLRSALPHCPPEASGSGAQSPFCYSTRDIYELPCLQESCLAFPDWVHSCLSNLTRDSFDVVLEKLLYRLTTLEQVTTLIHEVFDKATSQHQGVPLYAELCVQIGTDPKVLELLGPSGEKAFRRILLKECQLRFEEMNGKRQARGIMKFIGELLVRGMLSPKLLVEMAEELLRSWEICLEASFEPLVTLLVVAGPQFDNPSYRYYSRLLGVFSSMDELTKDDSTPEAMRVLLHSVLELRNAGWSSNKRCAKS